MNYNFRAPHIVRPEYASKQSVPHTADISAEVQICYREYQRYLRSLEPKYAPIAEECEVPYWETREQNMRNYYDGIDELGYSDQDRAEEIQHMLDYFDANPNPAYPYSVDTTEFYFEEYTKDHRAGNRFLKTERYENRQKRTAAIILYSYSKRKTEDMLNFSFCLKRGGRPVKMPKSRHEKAFLLLVQMEKNHLIPESHNKHVAELIKARKSLRKRLNTDRGYCEALIRKLEADEKVRFEHECLKVLAS